MSSPLSCAGLSSPTAEVTPTPAQTLAETENSPVHNPLGEILEPEPATVKYAFNLRAAEQRAISVRAQLDSVCSKLAELKPLIVELRRDFKCKPKDALLAGCRTWTEFCQKSLHRTDRAVQKLIAGKPTPKATQRQPELSSGSVAEERRAEEKENGERASASNCAKPASAIIADIEGTAEEKKRRAMLFVEAVERVDLDLDSLKAVEVDVLALDGKQYLQVTESFRASRVKLLEISQRITTLRATGTLPDAEGAA
jgi:hypothetical protein